MEVRIAGHIPIVLSMNNYLFIAGVNIWLIDDLRYFLVKEALVIHSFVHSVVLTYH